MSTVEDLVTLDLAGLKREHEYLTAVRDWARASLGLDYADGDRVEIVSPNPSMTGGGWSCYREALAVGQSGVAGRIEFNEFANGWYVLVGLDRSWSTSEWAPVRRAATGMAANETPEGFQPPSNPEGKVKHTSASALTYFSMPVSWVRRAATDRP